MRYSTHILQAIVTTGWPYVSRTRMDAYASPIQEILILMVGSTEQKSMV